MSVFPKVLIVSREVWNDTTASTITNLFENYDPNKLSYLYIETKEPNSRCCQRYFQISEFSLVHKLFKWRTKTGHYIDTNNLKQASKEDNRIATQEAATMQYVRGHRSFWFTFAREVLWAFNGWKTKELRRFIQDENPDVVWITGSPLNLMNRLSLYVTKVANKPYCVFEMDDVYPSARFCWNPLKNIYKYYLRKNVRRLIRGASQLFVISPKMKKEYDRLFGTNSILLTKGIDFSSSSFHPHKVSKPIQMVYMGQIIYDRLSSLQLIGKALDEINKEEHRIVLNIYTRNPIDSHCVAEMTKNNSIVFHNPVPYAEVNNVIEQNAIVVFVESLRDQYKNVARLSFSTKITDYLASGKCIFAVGPSDSAPIEYFTENDSALVASNYSEIINKLHIMLQSGTVEEYALKAYTCGQKNHDRVKLNATMYGKICELANQNQR